MDANEIIKRVKRIEIKSRRNASNLFMGEYHSSFKGRGMIFSEIRPYQYGDDVRNIDWNKTARYNEVFVKLFEEEKEQTIFLLVDISASGNFGTRKQIKMETIAEICATIAFSAIFHNDKVGLILYTDQIEKIIPAKKGKLHILHLIREIVTFQPKGKGTNLKVCLEQLMKIAKRKSTIFILSDFIDQSDYDKVVGIASKKHDITAIRIFDEKEVQFPDIGLVNIMDDETGETRLINTSSEQIRKQYRTYFKDLENRFHRVFKKSNTGNLSIQADQDYILPLLNYFKNHKI